MDSQCGGTESANPTLFTSCPCLARQYLMSDGKADGLPYLLLYLVQVYEESSALRSYAVRKGQVFGSPLQRNVNIL